MCFGVRMRHRCALVMALLLMVSFGLCHYISISFGIYCKEPTAFTFEQNVILSSIIVNIVTTITILNIFFFFIIIIIIFIIIIIMCTVTTTTTTTTTTTITITTITSTTTTTTTTTYSSSSSTASLALWHGVRLESGRSRVRIPLAPGYFSGSSHTSDFKIGTPVATLPGAGRYRVSAGTGRPGVSAL